MSEISPESQSPNQLEPPRGSESAIIDDASQTDPTEQERSMLDQKGMQYVVKRLTALGYGESQVKDAILQREQRLGTPSETTVASFLGKTERVSHEALSYADKAVMNEYINGVVKPQIPQLKTGGADLDELITGAGSYCRERTETLTAIWSRFSVAAEAWRNGEYGVAYLLLDPLVQAVAAEFTEDITILTSKSHQDQNRPIDR